MENTSRLLHVPRADGRKGEVARHPDTEQQVIGTA
jgi:hypothetical protein